MDQFVSYSVVEEGVVLENDKVINVLYTEMYPEGKFFYYYRYRTRILLSRD